MAAHRCTARSSNPSADPTAATVATVAMSPSWSTRRSTPCLTSTSIRTRKPVTAGPVRAPTVTAQTGNHWFSLSLTAPWCSTATAGSWPTWSVQEPLSLRRPVDAVVSVTPRWRPRRVRRRASLCWGRKARSASSSSNSNPSPTSASWVSRQPANRLSSRCSRRPSRRSPIILSPRFSRTSVW